MSIFKIASVFVLFLSIASVQAQEESAPEKKAEISSSQSAQITASVEAIDYETRAVKLRGPQGDAVTIIASDEATNLEQVSVGDILNVEIVQSISVELYSNPMGLEAGAGEIAAVGRTEEGLPGMVAVDTLIISATVAAINLEANTFILRGPEGNLTEFMARDPENLKKGEIGDLVVITFTEAVAAIVEEVTTE